MVSYLLLLFPLSQLDTFVLHLQYFKQRVQNQAEIKSKRKQTNCDGHGSRHLLSQ